MKYQPSSSPFIIASVLVLSLFANTSPVAGDELAKTHQQISISENAIDQYEQSGNYATALKMARSVYQEAVRLGFQQHAKSLSLTIERLEQEHLSLGYSRILFDQNYKPRFKLLQILELTGMDDLNPGESAVMQINNWAQKNLLRQGERWQEQTDRFEPLRCKLKPFLRELGFVDGTLPHFKEYQGAIIHGSLLSNIRLRLYYLVEQWKQGIRFSHLYFLTGERPLDPQQENENTLTSDDGSPLKLRKDWKLSKVPTTECEMIQVVWEQSEIPEEMRRDLDVLFVNAPMKRDTSGKLTRPNTDNTVEAWLDTKPAYGRYLAVTNAPYMNRQDIVTRANSPSGYTFDTIGSSASRQERIVIFLDELARCIFQIHGVYSKELRFIELEKDSPSKKEQGQGKDAVDIPKAAIPLQCERAVV